MKSSFARYSWLLFPCTSIAWLVFYLFVTSNQIEWNPQASFDYNKYSDRIYSDKLSAISIIVQQSRFFSLTGFNFCQPLDNSIFDSSTFVYKLNSTVMEANPKKYELIDLIDTTASFYYNYTLSLNGNLPLEQVRRFCCYAAAEGSRPMFNITKSRFLSSIDPIVYFNKQLPNLLPSKNEIVVPKRKFQIAYYIMVHLEEGFENLKQLVQLLDDGMAIILIHVDIRVGTTFISIVQTWVASLTSRSVMVASNLFQMCWGCSALVSSQLNGFFELLDMSDWDYVINLSNYDYPLLRNQQIYEALEQTKGYNRVSYWTDIWEGAGRLIRPVFIKHDMWKSFKEFGIRYFAYRDNWLPVKQSQWASYSREFIEFLRTDQSSLELLAFIEHTEIPDESYFALVIMNTAFKHKTTTDNNRYIPFSGIHARFVTFDDATALVDNSTSNPISLGNFQNVSLIEKYKSKYHFCRKFDAVSENNTNFKLWIQNKFFSY